MDFSPNNLRRHIVTMAYRGQSVHVPCAFSLVEVLSSLYTHHLQFDPRNPDSDRDFVLLSKGHGAMALYACLHEIGWLAKTDLDNYFSDGSLLHGLVEYGVPGCDVTGGSLGHGLSVAAGISLGLKWRGDTRKKTYCIVGDGELNEGSIWEAVMFAAHHQLGNLRMIIDANQFQAMGRVEDILNMEPLAKKFEAFGFEVQECDGHDLRSLNATFSSFSADSRPKVLIARTVKGKGLSFMEGDNQWHYRRLSEADYQRSLKELA